LRFVTESQDRLIAGRYRLNEEIGRGGMGTVWWAHDEVEDREVAVKEVHLPPSLGRRERLNLLKRTDREARAAGRLRHPGLIAVYDVVIEESRPWLVMEYVAARSLEDVFVADGPISPRRVADVGAQLLAALRAAHEAGIVHRDVKPSNVLLETSGRVVLTDFGIATYEGATTLTQTGTFMGSPAYVAPEVARGEPATPASDLWSLGATLYAAVEGRPPYDHETAMATLSALVTTEPDPPMRAGPLRPLLDGLLVKDPAHRLSAARAAELLAAAAVPPPSGTPPGSRRPGSRQAGVGGRIVTRFTSLPALSAGVLALAVAAGVVAGVQGWTTPGPAPHSGGRSAVPPVPPGATGAPHPSASAGRTDTGRTGADRLPATVVDRSGRPVARRLTTGGGTWPAVPAVTLDVPGPGREGRASGAGRLSVLVTCPAKARWLSFTAYAVGHADHPVTGSCAATGHDAAMPTLAAPGGGTSHVQVRVRVRAGPDARAGPVEWLAGVYARITG
jgi:eukaryotic-like serine/threonine-protein kinase